LWCGKG